MRLLQWYHNPQKITTCFVKKNESSDVYAKLCKKINVDPKNCVFVDDSYSNLEFAKELGMTTVRIYYNANSAKDKTYIDEAYKGINSFLEEYLPKIEQPDASVSASH